MKKFYFLSLFAMLFCCLGMHAAAELTFSNVSLAAGSKIEAMTQDQQITFNTNMDAEIGYMYAELKDNTKGEVVLARVTVYDPDFNSTGVSDDKNPKDAPQNKKAPHFTFVCPSTTTLLEGHNYSLIFYAFADKEASHGTSETALAKGSLEYEGTTPAYVGSRFKLLSVTPDLNTFAITGSKEELQQDPSKRSITLTFNAKVRMDPNGTFVNTGFGTSAALESITPGDDVETVKTYNKDGEEISSYQYSTTWTLTPKFSTMSDGADVLIAANAFDKAGLHVCEGTEYSTGADETSFYNITVPNDYGKIAFNLTPAVDDASVNSLYSFYIDGVSRGVAVAGIKDPAVVYKVDDNGTKAQVAQVVLNAEIGTKHDNGDEVPAALRLFLDTPVTKAGKYILSFPRNYFTYGSNMNAEGSPATTFEYTLKEDFNDPKISIVTPANVDKGVAQLDKLTLKYGAYDAVTNNPDGDIPAYVFNENKELVTTGSLEMNYDGDFNEMNVKLAQAITKPGKYTFIVPENAVIEAADDYAKKQNATKGIEPDPDEEETFIHCGAFVKEIEVVGGSIDDVFVKPSIEIHSTVAKIETLDITFEGASSVEASGSGMTWWKSPNKVDATNPYYDANYAGAKFTAMTNEITISGNKVTLTPWNGNSKKGKAKYGIDTDATVVLNIPAGYFIVNGISYPEINLIYTVDTSTAINGVSADANAEAKATYTLTGVKVNGENAKNGVFIVNGKKVILK